MYEGRIGQEYEKCPKKTVFEVPKSISLLMAKKYSKEIDMLPK